MLALLVQNLYLKMIDSLKSIWTFSEFLYYEKIRNFDFFGTAWNKHFRKCWNCFWSVPREIFLIFSAFYEIFEVIYFFGTAWNFFRFCLTLALLVQNYWTFQKLWKFWILWKNFFFLNVDFFGTAWNFLGISGNDWIYFGRITEWIFFKELPFASSENFWWTLQKFWKFWILRNVLNYWFFRSCVIFFRIWKFLIFFKLLEIF